MYSFQTTNYSNNECNDYDICLQTRNNVNNYKQLQTITVEPAKAMRIWTASVFYVYDKGICVCVFDYLYVYVCLLLCLRVLLLLNLCSIIYLYVVCVSTCVPNIFNIVLPVQSAPTKIPLFFLIQTSLCRCTCNLQKHVEFYAPHSIVKYINKNSSWEFLENLWNKVYLDENEWVVTTLWCTKRKQAYTLV